MAEHKVPQDVEAEDKLLGPFSFRQFLYLLVALAAGALTYFLGTLILPLALLPLPVAILFLVIALPLRKDQPMETYLAAMIHFYFSPNRRIWDADGQEALIEITNPRIDDGPQIKEIGGAEAAQRLSFLAEVSDTQGWSTRGVMGLPNTTNLSDDFATAAIDAPDVFDSAGALGRDFEDKLALAEQRRREQMMTKMAASSPAASQPLTAQSAQSYVHEYGAPAATPPAAPVPEVDEKALAAALRQSSQQAQLAYRQPTVQPLTPAVPATHRSATPPTATPTASQSTKQPVPQPTSITAAPQTTQTVAVPTPATAPQSNSHPASTPVKTPSAVVKPASVPAAQPPNTSSATKLPESATMETVSDIDSDPSVFTPPPKQTADQESVIDHSGNADAGELEVKLH
ncbi:MAG: PrgI family mobile element protein [Sphaerimonospora mesophila]